MGMSNRAAQNAFLRLQEVCDLQPQTEPSRETSECQVETAGIAEDKDGSPEVSREPPPISLEESPSPADKTKQEVNKRSRGRLTELEQQLEMAESRCGTLKQQLDYMRILYQGVDRSRTLADVPGFETQQQEQAEVTQPQPPPPVKVKKERRHHHHHKRRPVTDAGGVDGVVTKRSHRKHETASLCAVPITKTPRESLVTDLTKLANQDEQQQQHEPIRDLIDFSDHTPPAEGFEGGEGGSDAVQAIQDILCGISHTVNQGHRTRAEQQAPAGEGEGTSHALVDLEYDAGDEGRVPTRESVSMVEMRPASERTVDDIYSNNFRRLYANDNLTRKSTKTGHSPRRDHPYGLVTVTQDMESDESLKGGSGTKRKKPAVGKKGDKKPKASAAPYAQSVKAVADDVISVTTKPKKKKLMKTRNSHSRSTLKSHRPKNQDAETAKNIPAYSSEQIPYDAWPNNNLVEIYHNAALRTETSVSEEHIKGVMNDSDTPSMMSYLKKTKEESNIPGRLGVARPATGSTLRVDEARLNWERRSDSASGRLGRCEATNSSSGRLGHCEVTDSVTGAFNRESPKISHFELPTVSSRMKQVDRSYLQRFNFRTIPFVVGKSTTPTHNLGLNIQQVLSMIKMRQPVSGLSPMALAGGLLRESQMPTGNAQGPITSYLERMSSRPTTRRSVVCPPTIPEHEEAELPQHDDDDEGCRDFEVQRGTYRASRAMTSLDLGLRRETDNHEEFETYRADWGRRRSESTTFPNKKYNNYHQVLNQYLDGEQLSFLKGARARGGGKRSGSRPRRGEGEEFNRTLHHQMSGMKEVMQKLHDDFNQLSRDYDELCCTVERDETGTLLHQEDHDALREMAAAVQNKENECQLVMELLEEVSTLHKMVASLNQKTSMASMTGRVSPRNNGGSLSPRQRRIVPREPTTSVRLTRLLRTIQSFQEKLKQEK